MRRLDDAGAICQNDDESLFQDNRQTDPIQARILNSSEKHKFDYEGRIHYNGGPFAGRHFYAMIQGEAESFTTIEDAFAAEMVGIAAMRSSAEQQQVDLARDLVPEGLLPAFERAYTT